MAFCIVALLLLMNYSDTHQKSKQARFALSVQKCKKSSNFSSVSSDMFRCIVRNFDRHHKGALWERSDSTERHHDLHLMRYLQNHFDVKMLLRNYACSVEGHGEEHFCAHQGNLQARTTRARG